MELDVARRAAQRIADHVHAHQIAEIDVVFHGGEALLAGAARLDALASCVRQLIPATVNFGLQTNATLLTEAILDVLQKHQVRIGVSLDGPRSVNDRHRLGHSGDSSYDAVMQGIALVQSRPEWRDLYGGSLAVIDPRNDPAELYHYFTSIGSRSIDLLLPDYNHDRPPPREYPGYNPATAYGEWLARFFEVWYAAGSAMEVKYFEEIITLMLGGSSGTESIGLTPADLIVIETDGDIEPVDTLKTAARRATNLGMNVRTHAFDDALEHPAIVARLIGSSALCDKCKSCGELRNCGGGYVPHRFHESNGFLNSSVYCDDLKYLFGVIRRRIHGVVGPTQQPS